MPRKNNRDQTTAPPTIAPSSSTRNPRGLVREGNLIGPTEDLAPGLKSRLLSPLTRGEVRTVSLARHGYIKLVGAVLGEEEFNSLRSKSELNDEVVNGFLCLVAERSLDPKFHGGRAIGSTAKPMSFVASTFLYETLMARSNFDYSRVKNWTTRRLEKFGRSFEEMDIFAIPSFINRNHWVVTFIYPKLRKFIFYDPLRLTNSPMTFIFVRRWFIDEISTQGAEELYSDILSWPVHMNPARYPYQQDSVSCGLYVMYLCEALSRGSEPLFREGDIENLRLKTIIFLLDEKLPLDM